MFSFLSDRFKKLNNDKTIRQRSVSVLCFVLVAAAVLTFLQTGTTGIAMADGVICGIPAHTHDENCCAERILTCTEGHIHGDGCYETVWSCGLEEHSHSSACFSDPTADVESPETWESSLPELSGYPIADLVRIAESQEGYAESTRNAEAAECGDGGYEIHGYTRYGAFAGLPYCDNWSAAFVSFCLNYSGIPESAAPRDTECGSMLRRWQDAGAFSEADAHTAQPGDLVFFDRGGDGKADGVGIVTYASAAYIEAIEGDSNGKVEKNRISLPDGAILGYGAPASGEASASAAEAPGDARKTPPGVSDGTSAFSWLTEGRRTLKKSGKGPSGMLKSGATGDVALDGYITSVAGSGTTKVEENLYLATLELCFEIDTECIDAVTSGGYQFVYDFPDEVIIPADLINGGPYHAYLFDHYPELDVAFTYRFVSTDDGHTRVEIVYDGDFVQEALENGTEFINNVLRCRCFIRSSGDTGHDGLNVAFTVDKSLYIPPDDINENYDITTQKTGSYTSDGKLRYEITVSSFNGTPSDIDVLDTLTYSGDGTVVPPTEISVVKHRADGTVEVSSIPAQGHIDVIMQNVFEVSLNLPGLDDNEYYTLVYEYGVTGLPDENTAVSAYNTIEATSSDGHEETAGYAD